MQSSKKLQYLAGFLSTISLFVGGTFVGWSSPIGDKMKMNDTKLMCEESDWGWIVASLGFGGMLGSLIAGKLADVFGRKVALLISAPLYLLGWVLTYFAPHCSWLYFARTFAGTGLGISSAVCSVYIAEITEPAIRGQVGGLVMLMHNTGVVFSYAVGPFVSYQLFVTILSIFPVIFFVGFCQMGETPFYFLRQGDRNSAVAQLKKFRGLTEEIYLQTEIVTMENAVQEEMCNQANFGELLRQPYRLALIIVIGVKTIQQFSGISAITSNIQNIFQRSSSPIAPEFAGIIAGVMQLIGGILSSSCVDNFGRKPLLIFSAIGTAFSLFSIGLYFFLQDQLAVNIDAVSWVPFVAIMALMVFQNAGIGSVAYVLMGELFPTNLKGIAVTTCSAYGSFASFVMTKLFSLISDLYEMYAAFWLCASITLAGVAFILQIVFETKEKSLMEIQEVFKLKKRIVEKK